MEWVKFSKKRPYQADSYDQGNSGKCHRKETTVPVKTSSSLRWMSEAAAKSIWSIPAMPTLQRK